jgi:NADH-quinone oxidoreductase subunit L
MISEAAVWFIFLLPLVSFLIIGLVIRPFFNRYAHLSGLVLVASLSAALGLSIWSLRSAILLYPTKVLDHSLSFNSHEWLSIHGATNLLGDKCIGACIEIGILLNPLTSIMLIVVTGVSLMVQVYSISYMRQDPGHARYFAYMSLFTAVMIGLVLASNIIQLYIFWELVGLSSYLLIGFWHERPAAAAAAKKAFIITRIGDVGFLIAILYLFFQADAFAAAGLNAFHIPDIWQAAEPITATGAGILGGTAITWITLGIFAGAAGKSAQFPFHTWLPDAMEGPSPVSALIHAATMVAAGIFLVARFYPLFQQSQDTLAVVALIGAFTAFMAATMALVMNDIKRVLAYSTISQLGYMMAALGIGAYAPAIFHLVTHAFFKALLFLGAGSVSHATGTYDMRHMGGLVRYMPLTYILVLIGSLSLVGIIPLAGFWSKDEILLAAWTGSELHGNRVNQVVFALLISAVLLTAIYTFRMIYLTFHGKYQGNVEHEPVTPNQDTLAETTSHSTSPSSAKLSESPILMLAPMVVLAVAAATAGYLANPQWGRFFGIPKHWITEFLVILPGELGHVAEFDVGIALASSATALAGILIATLLYLGRGSPKSEPLEKVRPIHALLTRKYYVDTLYEDILIRRGFYGIAARTMDWLDRNFIDGVVNFIGWIFRNIGRGLAQIQTGQIQLYGLVVTLGSILIILSFLIFRS